MPAHAVTTRSTPQRKNLPVADEAVTKSLSSAASRRYRSLLSKATHVWGNETDAAAWLNNGHPELQNATPKSLLTTVAGERKVEDLLAALEYGFAV